MRRFWAWGSRSELPKQARSRQHSGWSCHHAARPMRSVTMSTERIALAGCAFAFVPHPDAVECREAKRLRMIILRGLKFNCPGMTLLQEKTIPSRWIVQRQGLVNDASLLESCRYRQNCAPKRQRSKSRRMTSLHKAQNNQPRIISLQKKRGEGPPAHLLCQTSASAKPIADTLVTGRLM